VTSTLTRPKKPSTMTSATARRRKATAPYYFLIPASSSCYWAWLPHRLAVHHCLPEVRHPAAVRQAAGVRRLRQLRHLATDGDLWAVVGRSLAFCIITALLTLGLGILFAVLMNAVSKAPRLILQVAMLLAWAMPVVAAMTVWIWLFDRRRGAINFLLDMIPGVNMYRFDWLAQRSPSLPSPASS